MLESKYSDLQRFTKNSSFFRSEGKFVDKFAQFLDFSTFHAAKGAELLRARLEHTRKSCVGLSKCWKSPKKFSDHAAPCAGENRVRPRIPHCSRRPSDASTYTPTFI